MATDKPKPPTLEEMFNAPSLMQRALDKHGITPDSLAKRLADELDAHEVRVFNDRENGIVYSSNLVAWDVRQRARMDAQKLLGSYPIEKKEISIPKGVKFIIEGLDEDDPETGQGAETADGRSGDAV